MAELIIRFVKTKDLIADIIALDTFSIFDHTEAKSRSGGWIGAHADGGFQDRPFNYSDPIRDYQYSLTVTQAQYDKAQNWAESKIGTSYNFANILGLLIHNREFDNKHELICSQAMVLFLEAAELKPLNVTPAAAHLITPETLHLSPLFGLNNRIVSIEPNKDFREAS